MNVEPLIREGERSDEVADVQARLRALGVNVEDETGFFGESTKRAVRDFQQRRGILTDGIVGPHTWNELVEAGWRLGDRVLYLRVPAMRGDDVFTLQARLNALGFDAGREDGIFGRNTYDAVREFQRQYGIAEDGICGPKTYAALTGLRAERPATAASLRDELSRSEKAGLRGVLVVVDPGHGGPDRGETGPTGSCEADLCWDVATRLARRLAESGAAVRFTRTEPAGLDITQRAQRANDLEADLFISLHLNSHTGEMAEGASTYYFPRSRGGELIADRIQHRLIELGLADCRSHPRSYPILKETRMPAVLVEPAFITNTSDAKRLEDAEFRSSLADAIASAVRDYYEQEA